jgi:uroporphyrinogen-III decarboxylase
MFEKGFQRFNDSLNGTPDRVPFIAQMHEFAMKWSRNSAKRFYSDPEFMVRATLDAASDFGFDIPWLGYDVYNIEAEALGIPLVYSDKHPPEVATNKPLIRTKNDLAQLKIPDPYSTGRMPMVLEANKLFEDATGYPPPIQFTAPFSLAMTLRGYENFILDIYQQPDFAHDVLRFTTENILAPWIKVLQTECPRATLYRGADAMASIPLVNIHILKKFVVPYIMKLKTLCGEAVTILNWWGESQLEKPEKMLELKLKISPTIIQGQDPDVEKIGPGLYKKFAVQNNSALILGIGNLFLQKAARKKISTRIRRYIKAGAAGGRFMIYFCYLSSETPIKNIKAAIEAVKKYGHY